jgi:hypothetical protein
LLYNVTSSARTQPVQGPVRTYQTGVHEGELFGAKEHVVHGFHACWEEDGMGESV